ncbi:HipA domain-containing protein [Skermanella sp. TT6]|uniref:HipA domain-containing protein n=1 Tax=Skermanella cutis TaxID=2775420 RepID=A0ABX7B2Y9_9PROT|nr:HipA domain-containing protein [Skermanella sp. TT6]QQP88541.1 HipA domain-containing protein [Skermanella sp. TT6]
MARVLSVLLDDLPVGRLTLGATDGSDMHHKNWSLIYPDGLNAALSPAYDLVSTIQYHPDDTLALNLGGSKRWEDVTGESFRRMARKAGIEEGLMAGWVDQARTAILDAWQKSRTDFGYNAQARENIERHLARVPLLGR